MAHSSDPVVRLVMAHGALLFSNRRQRRPIARLAPPFALSGPERAFARALLVTQTRYWLFRTHQQQRAGDFIALDRSAAGPTVSRCFAIELKASSSLRLWRRGTQLTDCERAARWLQDHHAVTIDRVVPVVGERADLLTLLHSRVDG